MPAALLACDWGTTKVRAWSLDAVGEVLCSAEFSFGAGSLAPGEAPRRFNEEVRPALEAGGIPAILCGMVGSNLGWATVPYLDCPAGAEAAARALHRVAEADGPARIVPGLRCEGPLGAPDVMRGEETQVFGWLEAQPERRRGVHLICHPGTHAKWILVRDGAVSQFATFMTGELFAVLRRHSVLRSDAPAEDLDAFDEGCEAAGRGDMLCARLFTARTRVVGSGRPAESTPSYLSGLLVGAEAAGAPDLLKCPPETPIALIGEPALCRWYERALRRIGRRVETFDGEAAAIAGLRALHALGERR